MITRLLFLLAFFFFLHYFPPKAMTYYMIRCGNESNLIFSFSQQKINRTLFSIFLRWFIFRILMCVIYLHYFVLLFYYLLLLHCLIILLPLIIMYRYILYINIYLSIYYFFNKIYSSLVFYYQEGDGMEYMREGEKKKQHKKIKSKNILLRK